MLLWRQNGVFSGYIKDRRKVIEKWYEGVHQVSRDLSSAALCDKIDMIYYTWLVLDLCQMCIE